MPMLSKTDNNFSISSLQYLSDFFFQIFHAFLLCGSDMVLGSHTPAPALGMSEFEKMCQLVTVPGMHRHRQTAGGFLHLFYRPAFCLVPGILWRMGADVILYHVPGVSDCLLYILSGKIRIFLKSVHDGIRQGID